MEWYKFDIAAYRQATQALDCREHGIYRRLLDLYYTIEGPLLNDLRRLKQELNCRSKYDHQALINVLSAYFILDASTNHYHNPKADKELIDYKARQEKNKANAHIRWNGANGNANGNASAMPIQTDIHTKKQTACGYLLENGQKCEEGHSFWTRHGKGNGCSKHGPF